MTGTGSDGVADVFGLAGSLPRPGWVVLDAAREPRFTGELVLETSPPTRAYLDRGEIYLAERLTDPTFGQRLVDAGALSAVQLEQGSVKVGGVEHLGRLFERVPSVDRHTVLVTSELMTEECLGWIATQLVPAVRIAPYRHHPSGMRQWSQATVGDVEPAAATLPAPPPGQTPVSFAPPTTAPMAGPGLAPADDEDVIRWNEPSWLDEPLPPRRDPVWPPADPVVTLRRRTSDRTPAEAPTDRVDQAPAAPPVPEPGPLDLAAVLPPLSVEPLDRFEVIWPSGEIDEEFGAVDHVSGGDHDRIGATARLRRRPEPGAPADDAPPESYTDLPVPRPAELAHAPDPYRSNGAAVAYDHGFDHGVVTADVDDDAGDDIVLAVRRAVASIDVGGLAARQRLAESTDRSQARGGVDVAIAPDTVDDELPTLERRSARLEELVEPSNGVLAPGRVAVRSGRNDWSRRTVSRSVFDEPAVEPAEIDGAVASTGHEPDVGDTRDRRAGALRRLITSLRR